MENLMRLLEKYRDSEKIEQILEGLKSEEPPRLLLNGLVGSQECFALTGSLLAQPKLHLFIGIDKEDAAYIQNTLTSLMAQKPALFLPDSFKRPMQFEDLNNTNVLSRAGVVNQLPDNEHIGKMVVTYPEALFEKVVAPNVLAEQKVEIKKGEKLDVDFLMEVLLDYGFNREEFVYDPGQFSIRGGIVDIFSYGNDYPYRVELFDDEVESIRTFNPTDQLSVQNIARVAIVPNLNTKFSQIDKVSIFSILPENTVIWIKDYQVLIDKLTMCFEKAEQFAKSISQLDESEVAEIFRDRAFIRPHEIAEDIKSFPIVFLKKPDSEIRSLLGMTSDKFHTIDFNSKPQPSFNKNFPLLIENLHENSANALENYLFTENPRQVERFYAIFQDLDANVSFHPVVKGIHQGFIDFDHGVAVYTDHQIFERFHAYRLRKGFSKDQALNLKLLRELAPGDYVTHIDHGVGKFSGLEKLEINGQIQESVRLVYANNDLLYVGINSLHKISKYSGKDGNAPKIHKLGSDSWENTKRRTKKKIKDIAADLIRLYAKRKASKGHAFPEDGYLQNELEASFIYEDTPDQFKATQAVKEDMMKEHPMDRLICGDVGFGKTEVAIRAAFKAVSDGKQVAILVPTTILALQHYKTFSERMGNFGINVEYVNRFKTAKQKREIYERTKEGKVEILIGTHAILSKDVGFKDLGLLVIDEEQKFGVAAKEKLRNLKVNVDTLTLTATPIPRTLQFSLMAARDLSVMRTPPPNRQPIHTEQRIFNEDVIKDALHYEYYRGGQTFFVHNRVKTLPDIAALIQRLCPDMNVAMAHGQLDSKKLEETLLKFIDKKYDVLVCTNIIETGLDISNANTMIINNAHHFGLSDLHQLRGRVGRSNKKAFCYLFSPPLSVLTSDARKRLKTLEEFSDLGSGFEIAMRDLDIRGAGNLLGGEQSGFITDIGYDTYQKILEEALEELKSTQFKEIFKEENDAKRIYVRDVNVDTDLEMHLPTEYVESTQERLNLYTEINQLKSEKEIEEFTSKLEDRFGKIPKPVFNLFNALRLQWLGKRLGFEQVILKKGKLRCYFITDAQSAYYDSPTFQKLFQFIATKGPQKGFTIKKSYKNLLLAVDMVRGLGSAIGVLEGLEKVVGPKEAASA